MKLCNELPRAILLRGKEQGGAGVFAYSVADRINERRFMATSNPIDKWLWFVEAHNQASR